MKQSKTLIIFLAVMVLVASLVACTAQKERTENVMQAVTDENGEPVTDENGALLTEEVEAQVVTDENGNAVTEVITNRAGKAITTVINNEYKPVTQVVAHRVIAAGHTTKTPKNYATTTKKGSQSKTTTKKTDNKSKTTTAKAGDNTATTAAGDTATTKETVKKPDAPAAVTGLKVSDIEQKSVTLKWNETKCTGYELKVKAADGTETVLLKEADKYTKTSYTVKNLTPYTEYIFFVRAYNTNAAGTSVSGWTEVAARTEEEEGSKVLNIKVQLPNNGGKEDKLTVYVNGTKVLDGATVKLNGDTYSFKTEKKYKCPAKVSATLKNAAASWMDDVGSHEVTIDLVSDHIQYMEGEDD